MSRLLRMPYINNITIAGNLTRDVEAKYSASNITIARLSIAVNHYYKDENGEFKEQVSFIDAVAFGDTANKCLKDLHKGSPVILEGYLKTRAYVDNNQQNRKVTEINITKIHPLEKSENTQNTYQGGQGGQNNGGGYNQNNSGGYGQQGNGGGYNQPPQQQQQPRPQGGGMPPSESYMDTFLDSQNTIDDTSDVPF